MLQKIREDTKVKPYLSIWGRIAADTGVPVERSFLGDNGTISYSHLPPYHVESIAIDSIDNRTAVMILLHERGHRDVFVRMNQEQRERSMFHLNTFYGLKLDMVPSRSVRAVQRNEVAAWRRALKLKSKYGLNSEEFNVDLKNYMEEKLGTYAMEKGYSTSELVAMVYKQEER